MEAITDYKLRDFLTLDNSIVDDYLPVLELLKPITEVADPVHESLGMLTIKPVTSLTFGRVIKLRNLFESNTFDAVVEAVSIVTKLPVESVYQFTIIPFYYIVNGIVAQLIQISNMEQNELQTEDDDIVMIEAQASKRMQRFGIANTVDSLAGGDILKWKQIEQEPYMAVFTKLLMEKTKSEIMTDVRNIQARKINK